MRPLTAHLFRLLLALLTWVAIALWHESPAAAAAAAEEEAGSPILPPHPPHHPPPSHRRRAARPAVVLYGEALCPDTASWVARVLDPAVMSGLVGPGWRVHGGPPPPPGENDDDDDEEEEGDDEDAPASPASSSSSSRPARRRPAATFRYVGWGNAAMSNGTRTPTCQHGPPECRLDAALNCAAALAGQARALDLLLCHFAAVEARGREAVAKDPALIAACADRAGIRDWGRVLACADGERGAALAATAAAETAAAAGDKTFVPWVVVDGVAMGTACGGLIKRVCEAAAAGGRGGLPDACGAPPVPTPPCPGAPARVVGAVRL